MSQKIFLTSALAMGVFAPAFAEPSHTGTFPADGYMEEDYTYTNAATADNMDSVYEGTVNAVAEYEDVLYQIVAGQYLPAGAESPIDCDQSGYFCAGVQNGVYYDANNNQGLTSCSDATNGAYTLSAGTGDSADSCFRQCDMNNMGTSFADIPHAKTVSGNDYYGNGTDTCVPTECDNGYHVKPATPDLMTVIGVDYDYEPRAAYIGLNGQPSYYASNYGLMHNGEFVIDYGNRGKIYGYARCSARGVENPWLDNNRIFESDHFIETLPDSTGQNCYCGLDGYTANGSNITIALSGPWVFLREIRDASCEDYCTAECEDALAFPGDSFDGFMGVFLAAYPANSAMCEANVININWSNADAEDISANNAGTATYGSDVRTPVKAQTIKGKTFRGWRFSKPQQTNLP